MSTELSEPIQYYLDMGSDFIIANNLINKKIGFEFKGYQCLECGNDEKIFAQGLCKKCFFESPKVGQWVMKPELSTAHLDIEDRDLAFEKQMQLQEHVVYLAKTSDIKVGVTRKNQVPTRWIDQGADKATIILEVPNRYLAGMAEVALKQYVSDKTSWQKMLKGEQTDKNLIEVKQTLKQQLPADLMRYWIDDNQVLSLHYPVTAYPEKVKSINLEKTSFFEEKLIGIKGQYLIFENGQVLNIRNHSGYIVEISF